MRLSQNEESRPARNREEASSLPDMDAGTDSRPLEREEESHRSGCGCLVWTIVLLLILGIGGAVGWYSMEPAKRESYASAASEFLKGSSLDFLRKYLKPYLAAENTTPPLPPINASGDGGVIPDRPKPADAAPEAVKPQEEPVPAAEQTPPPAQKRSDSHVKPAFIEDLASHIVSRYRPGKKNGSIAISLPALNQRYGSKMIGLEGGDGSRSRRSILEYAFTPAMVQGLYDIYADQLLEAIQAEASAPKSGRKAFTSEQLRQLYLALGERASGLAGALEAVAGVPDLQGRFRALKELDDATTRVNAELMDARFAMDGARQTGKTDQLARNEARVNQIASRLRNAMQSERAAKGKLAQDIRAHGARGFGDDDLLYLARWVARREAARPGSLEAVRAAAGILRKLNERCASAPLVPQNSGSAGGQGQQSRQQ